MFHSYVSHCEVPPNWSGFMHIFLASLWRYGLSGIKKNIRCCMLLLHDWSVWYALCRLWLWSSFTYCLMEVTPQLIFKDQWLKQWERGIFKNTVHVRKCVSFPSEHDGHCHFGGYAWNVRGVSGGWEKSPSKPALELGTWRKITKVFTSSILLVQILLSFLLIKPLNPLKCRKIISVITMFNLSNLCKSW